MISRSTEIKIQKITNLVAVFLAMVILGSTIAMFGITAGVKKANKEYLIEVERILKTYNTDVRQ